jgi:hypothetical protein
MIMAFVLGLALSTQAAAVKECQRETPLPTDRHLFTPGPEVLEAMARFAAVPPPTSCSVPPSGRRVSVPYSTSPARDSFAARGTCGDHRRERCATVSRMGPDLFTLYPQDTWDWWDVTRRPGNPEGY